MKISHAANTMTPSYLAILSKGFTVTASGDYMVAEKGPDRFVAEGPVELLGLIALSIPLLPRRAAQRVPAGPPRRSNKRLPSLFEMPKPL